MGKQSARMVFNLKDHKDIYLGRYHDQMYMGDQLLWEKIKGENKWIMHETTMAGVCYGNGLFLTYMGVKSRSILIGISHDGYNWESSELACEGRGYATIIFFKGYFYIFTVREPSSSQKYVTIYKTIDGNAFEPVATLHQTNTGDYENGRYGTTPQIPVLGSSVFHVNANDKEVIISSGTNLYYSTDCTKWEWRGSVSYLTSGGVMYLTNAVGIVPWIDSEISVEMFYFNEYWYFPGLVYDIHQEPNGSITKTAKEAKFWRTKTFIYADIEETKLNGESVTVARDLVITTNGLISYKQYGTMYSTDMEKWYGNYHSMFGISEINGKQILNSYADLTYISRCVLKDKIYPMRVQTVGLEEIYCLVYCKSSLTDNEIEQLAVAPSSRVDPSRLLKDGNKYFLWSRFYNTGSPMKMVVYTRTEE